MNLNYQRKRKNDKITPETGNKYVNKIVKDAYNKYEK